MSLQRQLLTILFSFLSAFFLFKAGFLTIQQFVISPTLKPFYVSASTVEKQTDTQAISSNLPTQIQIPDHSIDLPIIQQFIINGEWQVSTQGVSLLSNNQVLSEKGYVLFGHDWPVLLGKLKNAKNGQVIILKYRNEKEETYRITTTFTVSPNQLDILQLTKPNTILIYTCSGFLDSKRFVVLAQLEE